ncbi:hypothetical protein L2E82_17707 [Cichorium intybus]|uniref:Uncharacterized protein n=1 Tax=Cichorium intybus TaxID=13427 RepID=A0ACB9F9L6_CICIN|nr:hypothetical protein L2E82_17707 [Cichorium intybus]
MMIGDLGIEANKSVFREVAKLLPLPELLLSISSIKADYIARQQATDAQLSTIVVEQINLFSSSKLSIIILSPFLNVIHFGMRIVENPKEFVNAFLGAQCEAAASFGVKTILLEKYITRPRHIEVQAVGYHNAGTVDFIVDTLTGEFYFMEMKIRLQVEHPVTEMIVGQDLVEWQMRVANGQSLPLGQQQIPISVRVETGVEEGDTVSMHYDPMIAKLVVWGENPSLTLVKLKDSLAKFQDTELWFVEWIQCVVKHPPGWKTQMLTTAFICSL